MAASTSAPRSPFFLYMGLAFLGIAIAGFSTTFFIPLARGAFVAPPVIHVHGALLFGWLLFLIGQAWLVRSRNVRLHRRLGWVGAALCGAIVVSGMQVGLFAARRDLAATGQDWVFGNLVNIHIEMLLFGALVAAAIAMRRHPDSHKRLLLLATISVVAPAWFRFRHFMPFVPHPIVAFSAVADAVLLVAIARDWLVIRRVHPVYLYVGAAMLTVHAIELLAVETELWQRLGRWLLVQAGP